MMKKVIFILLASIFVIGLNAQSVIRIWEGETPPLSNELSGGESISEGWVTGVSDAEIMVFLPDSGKRRNIAVVICPGGGYGGLAINHEGTEFAKWLNTQGITGIVLKYRMPNGRKEIPLDDFHQAMRYVRSKSVEWGIVDEDMQTKIGVAGFSAGGHLASTASTRYNSSELRPDFSILFYPVITMGSYTHEGSRNNLLGDAPTAGEVLFYSNETHVEEQTPPTILLLSDDDKVVVPKNSSVYYNALKEKGVEATMYIFPEGGHGWGMDSSFKYHHEMLSLLEKWLSKL